MGIRIHTGTPCIIFSNDYWYSNIVMGYSKMVRCMRKKLITLGKTLIILGFLNPIPIGFIGLTRSAKIIWDGSEYSSPYDYWWPGLILIMVGFILCRLSGGKPIALYNKKIWKEEAKPCVKGFAWAILGSLAFVAAFLLVVSLIVGIYYAFFSKYMPTLLPICSGVCVFAYLIYIGFRIYKNTK